MPYTPKFSQQYTQELLGLWYTLSGAIDIEEGSPDAQLAAAIGIMFEALDARLGMIASAHGLKARGADLDDVVAQIMSARAIIRGGATRASGDAMRLSRSPSTGTLVVPAGVRFQSLADPTMVYASTAEVTFADGEVTYPAAGSTDFLPVACLTAGARGNAKPGTVAKIVAGNGMPTDVYAAVNANPITGGEDTETDGDLAVRGGLLLSSIAKSQPAAMRALASRYISADGNTTIRRAKLFEPAGMPGYCELVVSDSKTTFGATRDSVKTSGTAGDNGVRQIHFDYPAASEPKIKLSTGSSSRPASSIWGANAVVLHERGIIELINGTTIAAGVGWIVGDTGYRHKVYDGVIREIQNDIEGSVNASDAVDYGWRAAPCRVRVRPAIPDEVSFVVRVEFNTSNRAAGWTPDIGFANLQGVIIAFCEALDIGEKLNLFKLIEEVAIGDEIEDFEVVSPANNLIPSSDRHQFTTNAALITRV